MPPGQEKIQCAKNLGRQWNLRGLDGKEMKHWWSCGRSRHERQLAWERKRKKVAGLSETACLDAEGTKIFVLPRKCLDCGGYERWKRLM